MKHAYVAYAGGNPGFGVCVALWSPKEGCYEAIIRFIEHGTSNSGSLAAVADVLDYFDGEPVTIHTSLAYITNNLESLPQWAESCWQFTFTGRSLSNGEQWRRIYEHPHYSKERICLESRNHPMIAWAKETATLLLDYDLAYATHHLFGRATFVQKLYPASWDDEPAFKHASGVEPSAPASG